MAIKTFQCPNCTCVMALPQFEGNEVSITCIACKAAITLKTSAQGATTAEVV